MRKTLKQRREERRQRHLEQSNPQRRIVSMSRLGTFGRWGNSLFQWAFGHFYAEKYNAVLQTPAWDGQKVFNITNPPIDRELPQTNCDEVPWGKVNIDLLGYYQHADFLKIMSRSKLKEVMKFQNHWTDIYQKPRPFYIAAHVRRGDYGGLQSIFALLNESSYINACHKFGLNLDDLVWVHEERPESLHQMDEAGLPFLKDFMTLVNADVILRGNSTFSWWAAVLSNAKIYSPLIGDNRGECDVEFVEGNWPAMANFKKWQPHCPQYHGDLHLPE